MRRGVVARRAAALGVAAGLLLLSVFSPAEERPARRALLVGIDKYRPPGPPKEAAARRDEAVVVSSPAKRVPASRGTWTNLDGAVNDVLALRELLIARFGFEPDDIRVLTDAAATREAILAAIQEHLIDEGGPGDVALFAYAGHGSRVRNSLTDEPDGYDETLVPVDSHRGAPDIRDKQLNRLFNKVLDRGIRLTVISDSCHSGSIARGLPRQEKTRYLPPDERDVREVPGDAPTAEERGALILSAAQDHQLAGETSDEDGNPHGVFSLALLRTLQAISPDESAQNIFLKVKALMQSEGRLQEPVLAGSPERRLQSLFGSGPALSGRTRVAVLRKNRGVLLTLQGGTAVGLREGCELRSVGTGDDAPVTRLRVTATQGLSAAEAEVLEGDPDTVAVGDLFEVERWVAGDAPLRLWWPSPAPEASELTDMFRELEKLARSSRIEWVKDPTRASPTHVLRWADERWALASGAGLQDLGQRPSADDVVKALEGAPESPRLFVEVPPERAWLAELKLGEGTPNDGVVRAETPSQAHYLLVGRLLNGNVEYAWVVPNVTAHQAAEASFALPVRTDWVKKRAALEEHALRLRRLRSWLQLEPPPNPGLFPYRLALRNSDTGEAPNEGNLVGGEGYGLVLRASEEERERGVERRYVYVFALDSHGRSTLLFPRVSGGNVENRVPYPSDDGFPPEIPLGRPRLFHIGPPFGVDTYVLLSTAQPIPDPTVLQFGGVRTRGGLSASDNPLERLLARVGSASRGVAAEVPADWSIERLTLRSVAARE